MAATERISLRREFERKTLHLANVFFPVSYALGASREFLVAVLIGLAAFGIFLEWGRKNIPFVRARFDRAFGQVLRTHERRGITGGTWLILSSVVAVLLLPRDAAIAALWCTAAGDPAAALVGRALAQRRGRDDQTGKTLAGSTACFVSSFAGIWALTGLTPFAVAVVAFAATCGEAIRSRIDDNVRITLAAGTAAWLIS